MFSEPKRKYARTLMSDMLVWKVQHSLCGRCLHGKPSWMFKSTVELTDEQLDYFQLYRDDYERLYYPQHPLRTARALRNMTVSELAIASDIDCDAIRRIEHYYIRDVPPGMIVQLTRVLARKPLVENLVLRRRLSLAMSQDECGIPKDMLMEIEQNLCGRVPTHIIRTLCARLQCTPRSLGYNSESARGYSRVP